MQGQGAGGGTSDCRNDGFAHAEASEWGTLDADDLLRAVIPAARKDPSSNEFVLELIETLSKTHPKTSHLVALTIEALLSPIVYDLSTVRQRTKSNHQDPFEHVKLVTRLVRVSEESVSEGPR
jgi:hypothetical protein